MTNTEQYPSPVHPVGITVKGQTAPISSLPTLTGSRPFLPDEHGTEHYQLELADAVVAARGARERIMAAGPGQFYFEVGEPWDLPGMLSGEAGTTGWSAHTIESYLLDDVASEPDGFTCQRCPDCDLVATAVRTFVGDVVLGERRIAVWCVVYKATPTEAHWVGWPVAS